MLSAFVYCGLALAMFSYCLIKKKQILGTLLWLVYSVSAVFSLIFVSKGLYAREDELSVIPMIYLCVSFAVFFSPFCMGKESFSAKKISTDIPNPYKYFMIVYLVLSLISLRCYYASVVEMIANRNWLMVRNALYTDGAVFPYSNALEHFAMVFSGYMRLLVMILAFIYIVQEKYVKLSVVTLLVSVITSVITSLYTASRGGIVSLGFTVLALFCFFKDNLSTKNKRVFYIVAAIAAIIVVPILASITESRFGSGADSINSILSYFGQPSLVFNTGVWPLDNPAMGKYGIGNLFGSTSFSPESVGGTWGTGFYTFVGWLYIDWWSIGTIILGFIFSTFFRRKVLKKYYCVSDVFLVFFYYKTLLDGVFVIGRDYIFTIVGSVLIYIVCKTIMDRVKIVFGVQRKLKLM